MSEFWSYALSDLLMFSPRVYFRLFELHNQALWPAQVVTIILGLTMIVLVARRVTAHGRVILLICGFMWLWIAWSYFWESYSTINWAASYIAPIAALEGILLIGFGAVRGWPDFAEPCKARLFAVLGLLVLAVVGYPFIASAMGRSWSAAEVFGIAPDPTAIATLAVLAYGKRPLAMGVDAPPGLVVCRHRSDALDHGSRRFLRRTGLRAGGSRGRTTTRSLLTTADK
jgi:hypothetical protein